MTSLKSHDHDKNKIALLGDGPHGCTLSLGPENGGSSIIGSIFWYTFIGLCLYFTLGVTYKVFLLRGKKS